ncbi:MAG: LytTR family DNA-binding domain-containing protein [Agriterribacter sp.]
MSGIKALIIDDEEKAIQTLSLMCHYYVPEINEIKTTTDPAEGILLIRNFNPDILFIDIQMPRMNGFDLLKQIVNPEFSIIFTTAHDEYAIEAIRFSALDYLLKPIDAEELRNAFDRYLLKSGNTQPDKLLYKNFLHNLEVKNKSDFKLALPTMQGTFFYKPEQIIRLEGEGNYTRFFFADGHTLLVAYTLKNYDSMLVTHNFIRVHKSHLINISFVSGYKDNILIMADQSAVEVSRRRKEDVMAALKMNN